MMGPAGSSSFRFSLVQSIDNVIKMTPFYILTETGLWTRAKDDKQSQSWQNVVGRWLGCVRVLCFRGRRTADKNLGEVDQLTYLLWDGLCIIRT